eukprot:TRINITY_DN4992_c1_g2_i1.p1 TRINITY_DN4992_c1_g2~~TRINITY_DN4992_c1_g2_i1.p1  ORF type:complete len:300 (-),score=34.99 TRINITY_DN4992_c1_g2_i1:58-957(-)
MGDSNIFADRHICPDAFGQFSLDKNIATVMRLAAKSMDNVQNPDWLRKHATLRPPFAAGEEVSFASGGSQPSTRASTAAKRPTQPVVLESLEPESIKRSALVKIAEARRELFEAEQGPKTSPPRALIKGTLAKSRSLAPAPSEMDSMAWGMQAQDLDKPAVMRLLGSLQERLTREQKWRQDAEAKLATHKSSRISRTPSIGSIGGVKGTITSDFPLGAKSMTSSAFHEINHMSKAKLLSQSRACGTWAPGAAGARPVDKTYGWLEAMPPKEKPKRTRPLSSAGQPYFTCDGFRQFEELK